MIKMINFSLLLSSVFSQSAIAQKVQIHYLGHSAFVIQLNEVAILTDYGKPNAWKQWGWDSPIYSIGDLVPDIITYSHLHDDHFDSTRIPKKVENILFDGESLYYNDIIINAIPTCEKNYGIFDNYSYLFNYNDLNILHTGDIQGMIENINDNNIKEFLIKKYPENIDILIFPIEGKKQFLLQTIEFIKLLKPRQIIPSHYWSHEYLNKFIELVEKELGYHSVFYNGFYKLKSGSDNTIIVLKPNKFK